MERRVGELAEVARETAAAIVEERSPAIGGVAGSPGEGSRGAPGPGPSASASAPLASEDASPAGRTRPAGRRRRNIGGVPGEAPRAAHEAVTEAVAEAESRVLAKVAEMESR